LKNVITLGAICEDLVIFQSPQLGEAKHAFAP